MLKKENRLKSRRAYSATYFNNCIITSELAILYAGKIKTNKNYPTKVGFVVSKKIHKRAVIRNRIKRLMRENIRLMFKNNESQTIDKFQSIIFIAKSPIIGKSLEEIKNSFLILLNKLANKNI